MDWSKYVRPVLSRANLFVNGIGFSYFFLEDGISMNCCCFSMGKKLTAEKIKWKNGIMYTGNNTAVNIPIPPFSCSDIIGLYVLNFFEVLFTLLLMPIGLIVSYFLRFYSLFALLLSCCGANVLCELVSFIPNLLSSTIITCVYIPFYILCNIIQILFPNLMLNIIKYHMIFVPVPKTETSHVASNV